MAIFNSYVSLPEGIHQVTHGISWDDDFGISICKLGLFAMGISWELLNGYHLVMTNIAMENHHAIDR